jgi:hypothetical protein
MQTMENALSEMPKATLKIDKSTLERLKSVSINMDDTYDAIITRLLNEHFERKFGKEQLE